MTCPAPFLDWVTQQLIPHRFTLSDTIQPLWNGYGYCLKGVLDEHIPVVIKAVLLPDSPASHPKGWNTSVSDARKRRSFHVEHQFYSQISVQAKGARVARMIDSKAVPAGWLFVLEDLDHAGYPFRAETLTVSQSLCVLEWLANFHGDFMSYRNNAMWEQGSYWHLATRQDELNRMPEGSLKRAAPKLDKQLKACPFQTLLHGDAKVANFCFDDSFSHCAAIDFQYCGHGPGIIDVMYFLGSAIDEATLQQNESLLLEHYFSTLRQSLLHTMPAAHINEIIENWSALFPVACADFQRFLQGWSAEHWKLNQWLNAHTQKALLLVGE